MLEKKPLLNKSEIFDLLRSTKYTLNWNKKRLQNKSEISNFVQHKSKISDLLYTTKCTPSWNKKCLQNKSEIFDLFCKLNQVY